MTTTQLTAESAADLIETTSARMCREHYGMRAGDIWLTGGSQHNDDRLVATVEDDEITVRDAGCGAEVYTGERTEAAINQYVADWMSSVWA